LRVHCRKWRGKLVGHDLKAVSKLVHESRDSLFACGGFKLHVLE
jgi:hypothetical protein